MHEALGQSGVRLFRKLDGRLPLAVRQMQRMGDIIAIRSLVFLELSRYFSLISHLVCGCGYHCTYGRTSRVVTIDRYAGHSVVRCCKVPTSGVSIVCRKYDSLCTYHINGSGHGRIVQDCQLPRHCVLSINAVRRHGGTLTVIGTLRCLPSRLRFILMKEPATCVRRLGRFVAGTKLRSEMRFLRNVPSSSLPTVCRSTRAFMCPSICRNFNVPVLRTLRSNVPIITTANSYLRRTKKRRSLCIDPRSIRKLTTTVTHARRPSLHTAVVRRKLG